MAQIVTALMLIALAAAPICMAAETGTGRGHPYLFFDSDEVASLKGKCGGRIKPQFDRLWEYAREHLEDAPPDLEGDYERRGLAVEHPYLTNILDFSFLYVVTGERGYLEAAKRWALALASMKEWAGPAGPNDREGDRGLYAGFGLTALACAYDWLYADLTESERTVIRDKIYSITERIYRATDGGEWWSKAYLHHDHTIPVGGMGLGGMVLWDEVAEAPQWARRAEAEFLKALERLGTDGAWHEGVCGWAFAIASLCPFWDAYSRRIESALDKSEWLENTWAFRLYSRLPDGRFFNFGDGRADGHYQWTAWQAAPTLRLLARKFENPHAQWLAAREWETRPNPYTAVWEIIWADAALAETPPDDLPTSRLFENHGLSIMRTGCGAEATAAAFRCDSLVGEAAADYYDGGEDRMRTAIDHTHADAGSFAVWAAGDFVLTNAGYGQRDTEFQNSLLVDGEGQYRTFNRKAHPGRPRGRITRFFTSEFASFVTGDAARSYAAGLETFERTIFLVQPGVVFVVDDIAAEKPVALDWLFHVDGKAALTVVPAGFDSRLADGTTALRFSGLPQMNVSTGQDRWNAFYRASCPKGAYAGSAATVIVPSAAGRDEFRLESPAASSFVVETKGVRILAGLRPGNGEIETPEGLCWSGECAIASFAGVSALEDFVWHLRSFLAVEVTELAVESKRLLRASSPVTVSYCGGSLYGGTLVISSSRGAHVEIELPRAVASLRSPGGAWAAVSEDGGRLSADIPPGVSTYHLGWLMPEVLE